MIKKILIFIGGFLALVLVYAALRPSSYFIQRDIIIDKKPEIIFPYLASMKMADQWMPWKESDPHVKSTYFGPEAGVGSVSSWESTGQMGVGKAEVIGMTPNQKVTTKITYTKPMEMSQISEFILTPQGDSTKMTWTVKGESNLISRFMCTITFTNLDKFVGGEFEKGLNKLKNLIEKK